MTASLAPRRRAETAGPRHRISRHALRGATDDRLLFAQVRDNVGQAIGVANVNLPGGRIETDGDIGGGQEGGDIPLERTGPFGYTVRVLPRLAPPGTPWPARGLRRRPPSRAAATMACALLSSSA